MSGSELLTDCATDCVMVRMSGSEPPIDGAKKWATARMSGPECQTNCDSDCATARMSGSQSQSLHTAALVRTHTGLSLQSERAHQHDVLTPAIPNTPRKQCCVKCMQQVCNCPNKTTVQDSRVLTMCGCPKYLKNNCPKPF